MNLNLRLVFLKTLLYGLVFGQQQQQQQTSGSGSSGSRDLFKCRQMCYQKVSILHCIHSGKCISLVVWFSLGITGVETTIIHCCWKVGNGKFSIIYVYFFNLLALLQKWKRFVCLRCTWGLFIRSVRFS